MKKLKNQAAAERARLRAKKLSAKRRKEISEMGVDARMKKMTPEQRSEVAKKAAAARWRKKSSTTL
jgi:hypothetical protein